MSLKPGQSKPPADASVTWAHDGEELKRKRASLESAHLIMIGYLRSKAEERDWHGVADAACDLRVIEAKLEALG